MYEDLIEKIKESKNGYDWKYGEYFERDDVLDEVICLIKQAEPPKLGNPDSEGLWFRNNSIVEVICDKDRGEGYLYRFLDYYDWNRASNNAKWVKVLVPERDKNADNKS